MRPAWPISWTLAVLLHSNLCARAYPSLSVATYVDGQQIIVNLNYSKWSGYFNTQIHFATGKTTCHNSYLLTFHSYLPKLQAMLYMILPTPVGVSQTTSLLCLRQSTAALQIGEVSTAHHTEAGLLQRNICQAANLSPTNWSAYLQCWCWTREPTLPPCMRMSQQNAWLVQSAATARPQPC